MQSLERRPQIEAWEVSRPAGHGEGPELELPSECGLQPSCKRSGSGSESEDAATEEAERSLSSGERPQPPRRRSILEDEWFESEEAEEAEEAEEDEHGSPPRRRAGSRRKGWGSGVEASEENELQCSLSSDDPQGPQSGKAKATELEGMWDLEKMKKQLEQNLERGACGTPRPASPGSWAGGEGWGPAGRLAPESGQGWPGLRSSVGLPIGPER